jgi:hypothetical protein
MARPRVADGGTASSYGGQQLIYSISSRGQTTRGGPQAWGFGVGLTILHHKNKLFTKNLIELRAWTDSLDKRPKLWNMEMRLEVGWGDVDWIGLAKDRNRWRALVNSVLNLQVA